MNMRDIIMRKRDGVALSKAEIEYFVQNYAKDEITDYHAAALLMSIYFQGMTDEEITHFTFAMAESGAVLDLSSVGGTIVDKHSTGGIGDKVTLVVLPLVASLGVPIAKMSGRGLGNFGGTIDKLHAIPGFSTNLTLEQFLDNVKSMGLSLMEQTEDLCLADKKIYALRDAIGAVESIPLIASSVMSKKIASGADKIVLEVTTGSGAFMESLDDARKLAEVMVKIGRLCGRETVAVLTNMSQPLGKACGNALEVKEAIRTLQGEGEDDVLDVCLTIGAYMLQLAEGHVDIEVNKNQLYKQITNGEAWKTFEKFVRNQGGDVGSVDNPDRLPKTKYEIPVRADYDGYVQQIDGDAIGHGVILLGGGRIEKNDEIDYAVGIVVEKKVGDYVRKGDLLYTIHANDEKKAESALERASGGYVLGEKKVAPLQHILEVIS